MNRLREAGLVQHFCATAGRTVSFAAACGGRRSAHHADERTPVVVSHLVDPARCATSISDTDSETTPASGA